MVLQERIRKQKEKTIEKVKAINKDRSFANRVNAPLKSNFKTLAQLNMEKQSQDVPLKRLSMNRQKPHFESKSFKIPKVQSKTKMLKLSKNSDASSFGQEAAK